MVTVTFWVLEEYVNYIFSYLILDVSYLCECRVTYYACLGFGAIVGLRLLYISHGVLTVILDVAPMDPKTFTPPHSCVAWHFVVYSTMLHMRILHLLLVLDSIFIWYALSKELPRWSHILVLLSAGACLT